MKYQGKCLENKSTLQTIEDNMLINILDECVLALSNKIEEK